MSKRKYVGGIKLSKESEGATEWCTSENPCEECRKLGETTKPLKAWKTMGYEDRVKEIIKSPHKTPPGPSFTWMDSLDAFNWKEIEEGVAHPKLMIQAIKLLRKTPPTQPTTPEPSPQHPTEIASQVGKFFEQLQERAPSIAHSYLLHLSISLLDHPDLRSKADDLLRQLERHAKTPARSAGQLGFRWVQDDGNEPSG